MIMRVLVLGSKGQLGQCLRDKLQKTSHEVIYSSRNEIDISDLASAKIKIKKINPEIIINAAAFTSVDLAEKEQRLADLINHYAVANLANIAKELNSLLIHFSTDYVFDGISKKAYKETDTSNPICIYGLTKLNGEKAIQKSKCNYVILRLAWVYSEYGNNFLKTILKLGMNKEHLEIIGDQTGSPTYAQDVAKCVVTILSKLKMNESYSKLYHFSGNEYCSWFDFANMIFKEAKNYNLKVPKNITKIRSSEYKTDANRPAYSALDCSKINEDYDIDASILRDGIINVIRIIS